MKFQKGHPGYWLGKKMGPRSEEWKRKIGEANSIALRGRTIPDSVRRNMSKAQRGEKNGFFGKRHTDAARLKIKEKRSAQRIPPHTEKAKEMIRKKLTGHTVSKETRDKIRERTVNSRGAQAKHSTACERALSMELDRRGIEHLSQVPLLGITISDEYLPWAGIVIYADGDYWHTLPGIPERDRSINKKLRRAGFKVFRFWESDIKRDVARCVDAVVKYL